MDFETKTTLIIASFLLTLFLAITIWGKLDKIENKIKGGKTATGSYQYVRHPIFFAVIFFLNPALGFLFKSWLMLITAVPAFFIWKNAARNQELFLTKEHGDKYRYYRLTAPLIFPKISRIRPLFFSLIGLLVFSAVFIALNFSSLYFRYVNWESAQYSSIDSIGQIAKTSDNLLFGKLPNHEKIDLYNEPDSIIITKLGLNAPLILSQSASQKDLNADLNKGVIIYPGSILPGQIGNLFLSGHSSVYPWNKTPYGQVFAALDKLETGDKIIIYYSQRKYEYEINKKYTVSAKDVKLVHSAGEAKITLMTCWPIGTSLKRLVLEGTLIK